ncbi:MAG: NAD(P)/FAD-dependent oxidoreductase [Eubacteriales bacterium]|jgi:NAD(P)H-nitrite reductase large subunit|nr:NAD(P)/FAD-dependent oxidoreductase [Bacillota bacterium]MBV1727683.1 NAD(P)/FAD-dependent oxidoreductase [Desulforudis sp.]MDP3050265.1 NAD(P)/FAD-dependent oxidoreductase [Eubacteriales bacterium]MDQ7788534.1 NAD(P)/FAD-dependent oxidoreductase [Clostridia bacterium]MBU4532745.1 NAD(P)/FAD-dependent oxidoreductase [Bacillota bacterium]
MADNVPRGAILQRDKETYAIVPRLAPCGLLDVATLRLIADVAEQYQIPIMKITGAQRIAMVGLKPEDVEPVWKALGREPAPAVGPCVHYVNACPGTVVCRYGQQDALGLGTELDEKLLGYGEFTSKFKIGISGCPMNCCEAWMRDFGAFGRKKGWTVVVGGQGGLRPRLGDKIAEDVSSEEVVGLLYKTMDAYKKLGTKGERLGTTLDRVGLEEFQKLVLG